MRIRYIALAAFAFFIMWVAFGCAPSHPPAQPPAVSETGSSIDQAAGHIKSADNLVGKAMPEANHTGQVLLTAAQGEHASAEAQLVQAKAELAAAVFEYNQELDSADAQAKAQAKTIANQNADILMYKNSWGWRLEVLVKAFIYTLITLTILHFLLGAASLLIPVAFPAAIAVVPILRVVGAVVNPLSIPQFIFDHLHGIQCPPVKV